MDRYQLAAARGMLGWSLKELSKRTHVTVEAINKFERGGVDNPRKSTIQALRDVLEAEGIEFIERGVRRKSNVVTHLEGSDAIDKLYDDIIRTLKNMSERTLDIFGIDENKFINSYSEEKLREHIKERYKLGVRQRLLLCEGDQNFVDDPKLYRWVPEKYFTTTPTFVYGNKIATILWELPPQVIIINNELCAEERRRNFNMVWDMAAIPNKKGV